MRPIWVRMAIYTSGCWPWHAGHHECDTSVFSKCQCPAAASDKPAVVMTTSIMTALMVTQLGPATGGRILVSAETGAVFSSTGCWPSLNQHFPAAGYFPFEWVRASASVLAMAHSLRPPSLQIIPTKLAYSPLHQQHIQPTRAIQATTCW